MTYLYCHILYASIFPSSPDYITTYEAALFSVLLSSPDHALPLDEFSCSSTLGCDKTSVGQGHHCTTR